jgi:hypothetical protein
MILISLKILIINHNIINLKGLSRLVVTLMIIWKNNNLLEILIHPNKYNLIIDLPILIKIQHKIIIIKGQK